MRLALIPSPFVGAVSWAACAQALGVEALAIDYGGVRAPDWHAGAVRRICDEVDDAPWIAVLHSGAGAFAPALADVADRLRGFVFVDAGLPVTGRSALDLAPADLITRLRERTSDGRLAPWNTWFDVDPTERMIPDTQARAAFIAAQPRTPFAYLEASCPGSDAWESLPGAYLQLSRLYGADADTAAERGWPVERLRAHHLAMTSEPSSVGAVIKELVERITPRSTKPPPHRHGGGA